MGIPTAATCKFVAPRRDAPSAAISRIESNDGLAGVDRIASWVHGANEKAVFPPLFGQDWQLGTWPQHNRRQVVLSQAGHLV